MDISCWGEPQVDEFRGEVLQAGEQEVQLSRSAMQLFIMVKCFYMIDVGTGGINSLEEIQKFVLVPISGLLMEVARVLIQVMLLRLRRFITGAMLQQVGAEEGLEEVTFLITLLSQRICNPD